MDFSGSIAGQIVHPVEYEVEQEMEQETLKQEMDEKTLLNFLQRCCGYNFTEEDCFVAASIPRQRWRA